MPGAAEPIARRYIRRCFSVSLELVFQLLDEIDLERPGVEVLQVRPVANVEVGDGAGAQDSDDLLAEAPRVSEFEVDVRALVGKVSDDQAGPVYHRHDLVGDPVVAFDVLDPLRAEADSLGGTTDGEIDRVHLRGERGDHEDQPIIRPPVPLTRRRQTPATWHLRHGRPAVLPWIGHQSAAASRGMPASIWMVNLARPRLDGTEPISPVHSSSHRSRACAGSKKTALASSRRDSPGSRPPLVQANSARLPGTLRTAAARLVSSAPICSKPRELASGTKWSRTSRDLRCCFAGAI